MNFVGVSGLARAVELVIEKERYAVREMTREQAFVWQGMKDGCKGVLFLFLFLQIRDEYTWESLILSAGIVLWYVTHRVDDKVWIPLGMIIGSFVTLITILPTIIILEKSLMLFTIWVSWHSGSGPVIYPMETVGLYVLVIGISAFVPYGVWCTKQTYLKQYQSYVQWQRGREEMRKFIALKNRILLKYNHGRLLMQESQDLSPLEKDETAMFWVEQGEQVRQQYLSIIALATGGTEDECRQEIERIRCRALMRVDSPRYQQRHRG